MRQLLSQMDVPTRQAWVMAIVEDHEREAAASATNLRRTVAAATPATPALTGRVMQAVALSAAFALGLSRARLVFQRRGAHYLRHRKFRREAHARGVVRGARDVPGPGGRAHVPPRPERAPGSRRQVRTTDHGPDRARESARQAANAGGAGVRATDDRARRRTAPHRSVRHLWQRLRAVRRRPATAPG